MPAFCDGGFQAFAQRLASCVNEKTLVLIWHRKKRFCNLEQFSSSQFMSLHCCRASFHHYFLNLRIIFVLLISIFQHLLLFFANKCFFFYSFSAVRENSPQKSLSSQVWRKFQVWVTNPSLLGQCLASYLNPAFSKGRHSFVFDLAGVITPLHLQGCSLCHPLKIRN